MSEGTSSRSYQAPSRSCFVFGALRYFSLLKSTVCLTHGPLGCTFFHRGAVLRVNQPSGAGAGKSGNGPPRIFSTDFNERDTIFGGVEKLRRAILDIHRDHHPEVIVVLNCCVSEVIGEDIENVARGLQDSIDTRIVPVRGAGFRGDHKRGMKEASLILYDTFVKPYLHLAKRRSRSINYVGELNPNNWSILELQSLLSRFGITTNCVVPTESSAGNLRDLPNAELTYLVCNSASGQLAKRLRDDCGIPFVGQRIPYLGLENSRATLRELLGSFGIESSLPDELHDDALARTAGDRKLFQSRTACIVCGTRRSVGYSALLAELGLKVTLVFAESDEEWDIQEDLRKRCDCVIIDDQPEAVLELVREKRPDILLTSLSSLVVPERYILGAQNFYGYSGFINAASFLRRKLEEYDALAVAVE